MSDSPAAHTPASSVPPATETGPSAQPVSFTQHALSGEVPSPLDIPAGPSNPTARTVPVDISEDDLDRLIAEETQRVRHNHELQARISRKRAYAEALLRGELPELPVAMDPSPRRQRTTVDLAPTAFSGESGEHHFSFAQQKIVMPTIRYEGKNWTELQSFLYELRTRFYNMDPRQGDVPKILYGQSCLYGAVRRRWVSYMENEHDGDVRGVTWSEMEDWCGTMYRMPPPGH